MRRRAKAHSARRFFRQSARAFTLVELLVVIAIVGVLSTIGITLFREHVRSGRAIEAFGMIQSIAAAQERWRAESQRYLDVSSSLTTYYPRATPDTEIDPWEAATHDDFANWRKLNVTHPGMVQCVYTTVAGNAGTDPNVDGFTAMSLPDFGVQNEPWYLIHAKSDLDGDSHFGYFMVSSITGEVHVKDQGE